MAIDIYASKDGKSWDFVEQMSAPWNSIASEKLRGYRWMRTVVGGGDPEDWDDVFVEQDLDILRKKSESF